MAGPALLATGSAVPATVRTNDDPVFDWLRANNPAGSKLFTGYGERRVLADGEQLPDLMAAAAKKALERASQTSADIDLIVGYGSIGTWAMPNDLVTVARALGLPDSATILPINNEFANFNQGLVLADALIRSERAAKALVVVGANWTSHVDYHDAPAVSAGDGAGATVIAASDDNGLFRVRDVAVSADRQYFGGMYVSGDPTQPDIVPPTFRNQVFHLNEKGREAFETFGMNGPPDLVKHVLGRNHLTPGDVSFIGHQASAMLSDHWKEQLRPAQFLSTITTYGNMTAASIPVTLDTCAAEITTSHVVLAALGPEPSCTVLLLERA